MGMQDRDWYWDLQKERARKQKALPFWATGKSSGLSRGLKMAPLGIIVFWAVVIGCLYFAMNHYLKPKQAVVSSNGDLVIPPARDGHFYAQGEVNGQPVNFLVDTGASLVTVSQQFAHKASIPRGEPNRLQNGPRRPERQRRVRGGGVGGPDDGQPRPVGSWAGGPGRGRRAARAELLVKVRCGAPEASDDFATPIARRPAVGLPSDH